VPLRSGLTACIQLQEYAHVCNRLLSEVASQCRLTLPVPQFSPDSCREWGDQHTGSRCFLSTKHVSMSVCSLSCYIWLRWSDTPSLVWRPCCRTAAVSGPAVRLARACQNLTRLSVTCRQRQNVRMTVTNRIACMDKYGADNLQAVPANVGPETISPPFPIWECKDWKLPTCSSACLFVWVWNMVTKH